MMQGLMNTAVPHVSCEEAVEKECCCTLCE